MKKLVSRATFKVVLIVLTAILVFMFVKYSSAAPHRGVGLMSQAHV